MTQLSGYAGLYHGIRFARSDDGILEVTLHTRGGPALWGVHTVWPMLLGPNRGRYFLLTGERIDAQEARRLGVVGEVLAADALMPRARELAAQLGKLPLSMLRYTRALLVHQLRRRMQDELASGLAHEALATLVPRE